MSGVEAHHVCQAHKKFGVMDIQWRYFKENDKVKKYGSLAMQAEVVNIIWA